MRKGRIAMSEFPTYAVPANFKDAHIDAERYRAMYRRSIDDPEGFWSDMASEFLSWDRPWDSVLSYDFTRGEAAWFTGGKLNVSYNCIDRHLPQRADQNALIWEGDDPGDSAHITYGELKTHVCKLANALKASRHKIIVFLVTVLTVVILAGTLMFLIEGKENGFVNIPTSIYWAIVTLTTVGYGDISPATPLGQFLAAVVMVLGYAIIAVPTGIVSVAMSQATHQATTTRVCTHCMAEDHRDSAEFCYHCGTRLPDRGN